ncbi:pyridoxamine 5'-phosphate oxidase family protein [Halorubellus sp. JP-L1]|uniref:pyridoxamine 5'-phosphate oxidase family protein n=1 Tax=Halorubellus sp. JP-L1 TaxID=2715753 RepID=UPI0014096B6F|nr:pyridoxamine 5'-phosphate oxidase family protein [Halorubellus sp. JP-L1]NHN43082.1 pyridoxamine 5'-phosphate oxidase family protein [Halorubellus sp. JP-L1]
MTMQLRGDPDREWADAFLDSQTIPIRVATRTPAGGLWMLSLWYGYEPGDGSLHLATSASAQVVEYLEHDPELAFEVSTNQPPYRGVRGQGEASLEPDDEKALLRALVDEYLGDRDTDLANWLLRDDREEIHVTVDVDRAYAWDYSDRMSAADSTD